jgi:uncharacterized protein YbaP (TraB family)
MAKQKQESKAQQAKAAVGSRSGKAVRLDLKPEDFERLERQAQKRGLNKASYARMAVLERLESDEEGD